MDTRYSFSFLLNPSEINSLPLSSQLSQRRAFGKLPEKRKACPLLMQREGKFAKTRESATIPSLRAQQHQARLADKTTTTTHTTTTTRTMTLTTTTLSGTPSASASWIAEDIHKTREKPGRPQILQKGERRLTFEGKPTGIPRVKPISCTTVNSRNDNNTPLACLSPLERIKYVQLPQQQRQSILPSPFCSTLLADAPPLKRQQPQPSQQQQQRPLQRSRELVEVESEFEEEEDEEDSDLDGRGKRASADQLSLLEQIFTLDPLPSTATKEKLATYLGMSPKKIQIWFQNKRARLKRKVREGNGKEPFTFHNLALCTDGVLVMTSDGAKPLILQPSLDRGDGLVLV